MRSQYLEQTETLLLVLQLLLNQLLDELLELRLASLGDQWLLQKDLVDKSVNISSNKFQNYAGKNSCCLI